MTDVFISYARVDGKPFMQRLHAALQSRQRDVWVDWEDIPRAVNFLDEIYAGIESTNTFVFIMSPGALRSEVCNMEVAHAVRHNKRIIPLVITDLDQGQVEAEWKGLEWEQRARANWQVLRHLNWLFFRETDDFTTALDDLLNTIDTDIDHVRQHTRLLVRAREWAARNHAAGYLLQGEDLREAESWLANSAEKAPEPTDTHREYIAASRAATRRRQRITALGVAVTLVIALLAAVATWQSIQAEQNRVVAVRSAATATIAQGEALVQAEIASTQAAIAGQNAATATIAQGEALIQAEIASTQAAIAGQNAATATIAQGEALVQAEIASTQAAIAQTQAAIATQAQGEAISQFFFASTQAAIARENAATATVAQGDALFQAATATIAQGEALIQAATASSAEAEAQVQLAAANKLADIINRGGIQRETDPSTELIEDRTIDADEPNYLTFEVFNGRYTDFVLGATILWPARQDENTNSLDCGFLFRYTNDDDFNQIAINRQRLLRFRQRENGEWSSWLYGNAQALSARAVTDDLRVVNTLTLLVAGNRYSVFINGEYAFQFQEDDIDKRRTRIGLIASAAESSLQTECIFTDIWVRDYTNLDVTCTGSPPPRLEVGTRARVVPGGVANRLRSGPSTRTGQVVDLIPPGALITVFDGPVCDADLDLTWWQVNYQGNTGWTAEGQDDEYFLEPFEE